jgi:uncharacterized phage infection (PIP) family protein YhgE
MKRALLLGAAALIALAVAVPLWLVLDGGGNDGRRTAALQEGSVDCSRAKSPELCAEGARRLRAYESQVAAAAEELSRAESELKAWEETLNSAGDDAQLANVDLQNILQKQQQTLQMMSNISKLLYDTAQSVIRKMGG